MARSDHERVVELETRLAFLEQTVDDLSDIITEQQQRMALLEGALKHLNSKIDQAGGGGIKPLEDETPPPHY